MSGPLVCILAAGRGTRMGFADGALHKALVPLGNRAVLTRVIEQFPADARFVVAVGHLAGQIETYLALAHPDLDVTLVPVDPYQGAGSGPGRSLLACAEHLREPFVLTASDTLVSVTPALGATSWMGVADVDDPTSYLTLDVGPDGRVAGFQERTGPSRRAFVGLAWITEPDTYFAGVRTAATRGELQVTPGFAAMVEVGAGIDAVPCDWIDTGTTASYEAARARFDEAPSGGRAPTDVTYLLDHRVVKWFRDPASGDRVVARALDLGDAVPTVIPAPSGWLAYERAEGDTLRDALTADSTTELLEWAGAHLWTPRPADAAFRAACRAFYGEKTLGRLHAYLRDRDMDEPPAGYVVNGLATAPVAVALADELDALVDAAVATRIHGDLHEGNVIAGPNGLCLIDWRDDFGGLRDRGDQLYDLAKLLHTLELPESVMSARTWRTEPDSDGLRVTHPDSDTRRAARAAFWAWCDRAGLDLRALGILDALVFVNMAPLYDREMGDYLYRLGRWLLAASRTADPGAHEATFSAAVT